MMKFNLPLMLTLTACALSACGTVGENYAKQHPELPPQQLQILRTGKVPDGTAIAGMTREQVQVAMGVDPAQYTKIDGQDAWVYVQKKLSASSLTPNNTSELDRRDNRNRKSLADEEHQSPQDQAQTKTTIYFQGNVATRAEVANGGL
jgi:outer membrane protein assembly factor BamE (lipoprotein component of BamABCDE complex)